jgi:predicted metalloprotease with PDZ domain
LGYTITLASFSNAAPSLHVHARLRLSGDTLAMTRTRACDLSAICGGGWPALIHDLRVTDAQGRVLQTSSVGPGGWIVAAPAAPSEPVALDYTVDYASLADHDWPAPRETAYSDGVTFYTLGRPVFVGPTSPDTLRVRFNLPPGTTASAPWLPRGAPFEDLSENGIVFGPAPLPRVSAGNFVLEMALFGAWAERSDLVAKILGAHVTTFTALLDYDQPGRYLATFLVDSEFAGESFPNSYALSASPQADSTAAQWGRVIGHELFHFWNGSRLRGADYASSQWFQEGMTEYYAILSMARNHLVSADAGWERLSEHLRAERKFGKSLTASGTRKDRGFYGKATLVALGLDITIRNASAGRSSLDDFMRALWHDFGAPRRPYTQGDVIAAANRFAGRDLSGFFNTYVEGETPLDLEALLPLAGLRLTRDAQNVEHIVPDPAAPVERRAVGRSILGGSPR